VFWNVLFGLLLIGVVRYGDYITNECPQGNYTCPSYCDVDHKHYPRKECKDAIRKGNIRKTSGQAPKESQKNKEEKIEECNNGKSQES